MRVSPLGIFGAHHNTDTLVRWAMQDAELTHPNPICTQVNALFCLAIAETVWSRTNPEALYQSVLFWAKDLNVAPEIRFAIDKAAACPPEDYILHQGWVLTAFQNALWQLLHARNLEEALVDTIGRGGDTDTNAAICGALLGAVYGRSAVPERWQTCILNCRPQVGLPGVVHPRPRCFWPVDALVLADQLIGYEQEAYHELTADWANAVL